MMMAKYRLQRLSTKKTYRVSKLCTMRNRIMRSTHKIVHLHIPVDCSSSMRTELTEALAETLKKLIGLLENANRKHQERTRDLVALIAKDLKERLTQHTSWCNQKSRSERHIPLLISTFINRRYCATVLRSKQSTIQMLLSLYQLTPPDNKGLTWRSAASMVIH